MQLQAVLDSQLVLPAEVPQRTQTQCKGHAACKGVVHRKIRSNGHFGATLVYLASPSVFALELPGLSLTAVVGASVLQGGRATH